MKPIVHRFTTGIIGRPEDWNVITHGPCEGLPVCKDDSFGMPVFYSWHKLDWRDRLKALLGIPLRLSIVGERHPPINLEFVKN